MILRTPRNCYFPWNETNIFREPICWLQVNFKEVFGHLPFLSLHLVAESARRQPWRSATRNFRRSCNLALKMKMIDGLKHWNLTTQKRINGSLFTTYRVRVSDFIKIPPWLTPSLLLPLPSCASSSPLTRISQQMPAQLTASSSAVAAPYCELQLSLGLGTHGPEPYRVLQSLGTRTRTHARFKVLHVRDQKNLPKTFGSR